MVYMGMMEGSYYLSVVGSLKNFETPITWSIPRFESYVKMNILGIISLSLYLATT